jgi:hypothetical protein
LLSAKVERSPPVMTRQCHDGECGSRRNGHRSPGCPQVFSVRAGGVRTIFTGTAEQ